MKRIILILILQNFASGYLYCQSFSVEDLVKIAALPSKDIVHFMDKKGYAFSNNRFDNDTMDVSFIRKVKGRKKYTGPERSITIDMRDDSKYFTLNTSSRDEYIEGQRDLIKSGFFYDGRKDVTKEPSMLFQKGNVSIETSTNVEDSVTEYTFKLRQRKFPSSIKYAEELLQFDSHEFLESFFGKQNVKKDLYYFSEKELKKCSVLFSGTRYQAVFVWGDENNLNHLSYILVTNILPTEGAKNNNPLSGNNEWQFQNGIHPGMPIKDLLKINEMDFDIYGTESDLAFMVKPEMSGKIDFKKTAVLLSCSSCFDDKIFNKKQVSALDVAKANLPMHVYDVIIYP
jgi:hypothetical protein